jgi:hypothetical protein
MRQIGSVVLKLKRHRIAPGFPPYHGPIASGEASVGYGEKKARWGSGRLVNADLPFDPMLGAGGADRLPLWVGDGIGFAASKRDNVILPVAWAGAAFEPRGRAGMFRLEFTCYLT